MKKIFISTICVILILCKLFMCVSCKKDKEVTRKSYQKGESIDDLSAYDVAKIAIYNWRDDVFTQYERVEYLDFKATALRSVVASRYERSIYRRNNDEIFGEKVAYNSGLAIKNYTSKRYYQNGDKAYFVETSTTPDKDNSFNVPNWGEYSLLSNEAKNEVYPSFKKHSTTYNIDSKDYLLPSSDDKVYQSETNPNHLICTLSIDVSKEAMNNQQSVAKAEFIGALGCTEESLEIYTATITLVVEKYNDTYRVLEWQYYEHYKGKAGLVAEGEQTYTAKFNYNKSNYTINNNLKP